MMAAVCWRVLSTMLLYCGSPQPQAIAADTFAIEMGRYDPALEEFRDISPPILMTESDETKAARKRLNTATARAQ